MLVDAIASIILSGMMLIPLINLIVGIIAGAAVAGPKGAAVGVLLALAITTVQAWWWRRIEWPCAASGEAGTEPASETTMAGGALVAEGPVVEVPTIRTGPAQARRQLSRSGRTPEHRRTTESSSSAAIKRAR